MVCGSAMNVPVGRSLTEEQRIQEVNARFYRALENLDLAIMEDVWLHDDGVACAHPGWTILRGWHAVSESWATIFRNTLHMRVGVQDLSVHRFGDVAWVLCTEHITSVVEAGVVNSLAQATNIFLRFGGQWLLVHHHAAPLTMRTQHQEADTDETEEEEEDED